MKKIFFVLFILFNIKIFVYSYFKTEIRYLESGRFDLVNKSLDEYKNLDDKKFLNAMINFYLGRYIESKQQITSIANLQKYTVFPELKLIIENINLVSDIISNSYEQFETDHFIIFLKGRDIILKEKIMLDLENIYKKYEQMFGFSLNNEKVRVEVYNMKQEFYLCSTLGEEIVNKTGVVGICKFNRIMILSPENLPYGYRWVDTLAHEYLHFIFNRITEFNLPLYLHEGSARYFDTMYRSSFSLCITAGSLNNILEAKNENKIIPFDKFQGSLVYLDNQEKVELAFNQLSNFVDYLINRYGMENFLKFILYYKDKFSSEDEIYKKVFNNTFDVIYNNWLSELDSKQDIINIYKGAKADVKFFSEEDTNNLIGLGIKEYIILGDKYYNLKNKKVALYQYEKALSIEPYNPVVMTKVARIHFENKNFVLAEKLLLDCIKVNPNYVTAYELLFEIYYTEGMFDKITNVYKTILDINPFNFKIRKQYAEVCADLGKIKDAIREYNIVKILNPLDVSVEQTLRSLEEYINIKERKK